jgi:putative RecB family exonuclease
MELYHQCPKRFEIQKIDGGYDPPGREALAGTFVHKILEIVMQNPEGQRTLEIAKDAARSAWAEMSDNKDFAALELSEEDQKMFRWNGWMSVENYFEMEDPNSVKVQATEKWVQAKIDGVLLRGIIDRIDKVDGNVVISDYKNGSVPKPQYRQSKWEQLNFYAAIIRKNWGVRPKKGRLLFTAHSEILETDFTNRSVDKIVDKTVETWSAINTDFNGGGFKAKPGPLCGWCPALATCPEGMADARMRYLKGRLKKTAPGYSLVADPSRAAG